MTTPIASTAHPLGEADGSGFVVRVRPAPNWWTDSYYGGPAWFSTRQLDGTMKYEGGMCHQPMLAYAPRYNMRDAWKATHRLKRLGYPARIESPNDKLRHGDQRQ